MGLGPQRKDSKTFGTLTHPKMLYKVYIFFVYRLFFPFAIYISFFSSFSLTKSQSKNNRCELCSLQQIYNLEPRHFRSSYGQDFVKPTLLKKKNSHKSSNTPTRKVGWFFTILWHKMALTLSRASLYCTFLGIVIFCIFTISSYVQIHLLCKYYFLLYYLICKTN